MYQNGESVWADRIKKPPEIMKLDGSKNTDVLVIGGGMAGILLAYRLKEAGLGCIVAEAKTIGSGATKNTTAKITAQHGLIYAELIARGGIEKARMYYQINTKAINDFQKLSSQFPCDFETKAAYVYSTDNREMLEKEAEAYLKIGIPAHIKENLLLPVKIKGALEMENQAQFNPLMFLYALSEGLTIYENTYIQKINDRQAITADGKIITAKYIVLATHYPLLNIPGLYFMKLYQHRSYVIALENAPDLGGMYLEEKVNGVSFRNYQDLLFIGGGDHKTGDYKEGGGYDSLRAIAKDAYPTSVWRYQWAAQDTMSLDKLPYIGRFNQRRPNLFVATGFNKWGMTGAMAAADVISNLIIYGRSDFETLFSPQRTMYGRQLRKNLCSSASGLLKLGGPRCSHMGCKLKENTAEKSWDCPCHGSRFDESGQVIDNPAKRSIKL